MRKITLTLFLLAATFPFMVCCNSSTKAEETNEIQIVEPADTLANVPMTVNFMSVHIPCTVNGKTKLFQMRIYEKMLFLRFRKTIKSNDR